MLAFLQASPVLDESVIAAIRALAAPGDGDLFADIAEVFLADVPVQMLALHAAVAGNDLDAAWRLGHQLRGSALGIGAARMTVCCQALELAARAGSMSTLAVEVSQLDREVALARLQIERLIRS